MAVQIQLRRDSAADWTSVNPTLAEGEVGLETDTGYVKIGDGVTAWSSLSYLHKDSEGNLDHTNLQNIGTNTHVQIDTHIADTTIHFDELGELSNVNIPFPASGEYLKFIGTNWVSATVPSGGGGPNSVTSTSIITDNRVVRGDGGARGIEETTASIDDNGVLTVLGLSTGGLTDYDTVIGDIADYGMLRIGNSVFGRTSYNVGNLDLDGSVIVRNLAEPATSNIEYLFADSSNSIRFALAKSGPGLGTYNPRSMIIAGPATLNDNVVYGSTWGFNKLAMNTSLSGADLGVQNDVQILGDLFVDNIAESSGNAGVTIENVLIKDGQVDGLDISAIVLNDLTDVDVTAAVSGHVLKYTGTNWIPAVVSGGGGTTDHGLLTGLADDDHTQYARIDGSRNFTGIQHFEQKVTASGGFYAYGPVGRTGQTPDATDNFFVLDNNASAGMTVLTDTEGAGSFVFGDTDNASKAKLQYNHAFDWFLFTIDTGVTFDPLVLSTVRAHFNADNSDWDVRMDGDTLDYLFFLNAGTDRIGIGTNLPDTLFHVEGISTFTGNIISEQGLEILSYTPGVTTNKFYNVAGDLYWNGQALSSGINHNQLINTHNLTTDIDHTAISNIGTNSHATIDTHIADTTIHFDEIHELSDVLLSAVASGEMLQYMGTNWRNVTPAAGHDPVTVVDTPTVDLTLSNQQLEARVIFSGVNHNQLLNTHNLTTDIDHDQLTNFESTEHFTQANIVTVGTVTAGNVDAVVSAASTTTAGKVELADATETSTGTDATRAVTPDGLAGSEFGYRNAAFAIFDDTTDVAVGDGVLPILVWPSQLSGWNLVDVIARVYTQGVTGTTDIQVRRRRAGASADMLSVKVTIGAEYYASDGTVDTANDDMSTGDAIYIDVDAVHSGTAPKGLVVTLVFAKP